MYEEEERLKSNRFAPPGSSLLHSLHGSKCKRLGFNVVPCTDGRQDAGAFYRPSLRYESLARHYRRRLAWTCAEQVPQPNLTPRIEVRYCRRVALEK